MQLPGILSYWCVPNYPPPVNHAPPPFTSPFPLFYPDNDDGSNGYRITNNWLLWGGSKTCVRG